MRVTWHRLGLVEYADGLELQRVLQAARREGTVDDTLLLLHHPPVLTLGRGAKPGNIVASPEHLAAEGVVVFETDRGGDVTYHGPGQIVGYPLLHLGPDRQDVRRYVRQIEEVAIRTVADFGVTATRIEQWPGVWVAESKAGGPRKICAIGVHLSRWYTRHGFALNVAPNLKHFELIVPCGITEAGVTSLEAELGVAPQVPEVEARIAHHFGAVFEAELVPAPPPPKRTVSVAVVRRSDGAVLLLQRSEARGGFWQLVTGHIEAGESAAQAAQRELSEETGLHERVTPVQYTHSFAAPGPSICEETAFAAPVDGDTSVRLSDEHQAFEWVSRSVALERLPFEGLREAVRRATR
ncbi:MAG: lipoyl(octanoyl) transferase LipB [Archangium sp.]|nr:lipoyl(octanoyl) transferase LipB [Archangium sp.]